MMNRSVSKLKLFLLLLPGVGGIALFVGVVMFMILGESIGIFSASQGEASGFTLSHWNAILTDKNFWVFFRYSFRQGLLSSFGAVLLAYPFALWFRKSFRGKFLLSGIIRIPMLIPGLVAVFLFLNIIAYHGILNQFLEAIGLIKEPLRLRNDRFGIGIIVLQIWKNMPFALLLLLGTIKGISSDLIDSARDFGVSRINLFRKIIFPLTLPAMRAVLILIFIGALGDFAFNVTAGPQKLRSLSQYILLLRDNYLEIEQAAVVSVMLMVATILGAILLTFLTKIFEVKREVKV